MLGDALVYGVSIYAVTRGTREKAMSAFFKGIVMAIFGRLVVAQAAYRAFNPQPPMLAAGTVWWTGSPWPDVLVGASLAALFLKSAAHVLREASAELHVAHA
jgi:Co/Zn/Cd efflux system component